MLRTPAALLLPLSPTWPSPIPAPPTTTLLPPPRLPTSTPPPRASPSAPRRAPLTPPLPRLNWPSTLCHPPRPAQVTSSRASHTAYSALANFATRAVPPPSLNSHSLSPMPTASQSFLAHAPLTAHASGRSTSRRNWPAPSTPRPPDLPHLRLRPSSFLRKTKNGSIKFTILPS